MSTMWEIDQVTAPEEPPPASLAGDGAVGDLTDDDDTAILDGVQLPSEAEGVTS